MIWDVVGFDKVADLQKMPKEVITTMKTYCESGTFQRGQEAAAGDGSIAGCIGIRAPEVDRSVVRAPRPFAWRDLRQVARGQ